MKNRTKFMLLAIMLTIITGLIFPTVGILFLYYLAMIIIYVARLIEFIFTQYAESVVVTLTILVIILTANLVKIYRAKDE